MSLARAALYHVNRVRTRVRRSFDDPGEVAMIVPEGIGLGNLFYFWLQVEVQRALGRRCGAVRTPLQQPWLEWFPGIERLVIEPADIGWRTTRKHDYSQEFGRDFSRDQLQAFVRDYVTSSPRFAELVQRHAGDASTVVVNVRRGDYYSVPLHRGRYSFDVVEYLREAIHRAREAAPIERVVIVSDDPAWCELKLGWLAETAEVVFPVAGEHPVENLARLAGAERLILANSTFSYWGGYIAQARNEAAHIIAPLFHCRDVNGGAAYQLDPAWDVVRDIPGGWDG